MIHDEAHEMKQDEAIRHLAAALSALAHRMGASDMAKTAEIVDKMMADDEAEEVPPAEAAETKSE